MTPAINDPAGATVRSGDIEVSFAFPSTIDYISNVLKTTGRFYESSFLEALTGVLSPGDLVLDVGANIGNHSLFFAKVMGCQVIAFEPVENTADILLHNVELNFADPNIEVRRVAVGSRPGRAAIKSFNPANLGATALAEAADGEITVTSLDAEQISGRVAFIKIDVEGMDLDVIRGGLNLIQRDRPFISCEVATPDSQKELWPLLDDMGYVPVGVYNATPTYILAPARTASEHAAVMTFQGLQLQAVRNAQKELDARLLRSNRYSERLHREALEVIDRRLSEVDTELKDIDKIQHRGQASATVTELQLLIDQLRSTQDESLDRIKALEIDIAGLRAAAND